MIEIGSFRESDLELVRFPSVPLLFNLAASVRVFRLLAVGTKNPPEGEGLIYTSLYGFAKPLLNQIDPLPADDPDYRGLDSGGRIPSLGPNPPERKAQPGNPILYVQLCLSSH